MNFSPSVSIRTWSLTRATSSSDWRSPSAVSVAFALNVTLGTGISSSVTSSVGILKVRVYFPRILTISWPVSSSRSISRISSLLALLRSFRSSPRFTHIFASSSETYSSNTVFCIVKSTIATRDGSMDLSFIPSGLTLNVPSSISVDIATSTSLSSFTSDMLSLNNYVTIDCFDVLSYTNCVSVAFNGFV